MKIALFSVLFFIPLSMLPGCLFMSSPQWEHEKDAINIQFKGDPLLNMYQGKPHSLIVCVYHLKDLNGFKQLTDERGGLSRLLECGRFDPGVTYVKRLVVQPNQEFKESMDRTEGAKYVGIVAGYYALHKVHSVRTYEIPVSVFNSPKKIDINLYMGTDGIKEGKDRS